MHHAYKQQTAALDAMMQDRIVQPLQPLRVSIHGGAEIWRSADGGQWR
jgi:hypothetical protein